MNANLSVIHRSIFPSGSGSGDALGLALTDADTLALTDADTLALTDADTLAETLADGLEDTEADGLALTDALADAPSPISKNTTNPDTGI